MGILENKVLKTISIQANFLATVSRKKNKKKTYKHTWNTYHMSIHM